MSALLKKKDTEQYVDLIVTFGIQDQDVSAPPVRIYF